MSNHVFISYARADAADFARQLHDELEKMGLNMWLDVEDIPPGADWRLTIQQAIINCRAFIYVITPESNESVYCKNELVLATEPGLNIYPVYLKEVEIIPFAINHLNYIDCRKETESGFKTLFDEISKTEPGEVTEQSDIIVPESVARSGAAQAQLYTDSDDVEFQAQVGLFGRDELLEKIKTALSGDNARVLLQAFGGVGKTALAAKISADWIDDTSENVLWLRMGASETDATFEALAHAFSASKQMASTPAEEKAKLLRDLIKSNNVSLVVLDDCWNGQSLLAIQKGIPRKVPILATARQRYPLTPIISIPDLPDDEAVNLLRQLAPDFAQDDEFAKALCQKLSNHAFAIEVAGRTMQAKSYTAEKFLSDIENTDITQLQVPLEYQQAGRESIAALIETTLNELPESARNAFLAWGAFFTPRITPELMMQFFIDKPEVTDEMIAQQRQINPDTLKHSDDDIRIALLAFLIKQESINSQPAEDALNLLQQYGLATRLNAQQTPEGRLHQVASYQLHDLGFEYAKAQNGDEQRNRAVDACLTHIARHNEASLENFASLDPNIDNFMGAVSFAMNQKYYGQVESFAQGLYEGGDANDGIFQYRGYYRLSKVLLHQAVDATLDVGNAQKHINHLGNLGVVYKNLGDYDAAIEFTNKAIALANATGNKIKNAGHYNNLGIIYSQTGDFPNAIEAYQKVLVITKNSAADLMVYGAALGNLASVYKDSGHYDEALDYYKQALEIGLKIGNKAIQASNLNNIGLIYRHRSNDYDTAIEYYLEALNTNLEIENKKLHSDILNNLGDSYSNLGDYGKAEKYFYKSFILRKEMGITHLIEQAESNLAIVRRKQAGQGNSDEDEPES